MATDHLPIYQLKPEKELDISYYIEECHHSETPRECVKLYDQWSTSYDNVMKRVNYQGPKLLIQVCLPHLSKLMNRDKIDILEIGPGSGESGRLLKAAITQQFGPDAWKKINLDGIDGSEGMLHVARNQDPSVYRNLYHEIMLTDQPAINMAKESYDMVIGVGVFSQGHLQAEHIRHFFEPVKRNGMVVFGCREKWFIQLGLGKKLAEMESEGVCRPLEKLVLPGYTEDGAGTYFAYERLG